MASRERLASSESVDASRSAREMPNAYSVSSVRVIVGMLSQSAELA
jgi:hypothetical protein